MSGKFLARASALSLAILLAACGGDDGSTPIVNVNTTPPDSAGGTGGSDTGGNTDSDPSDPGIDNGNTDGGQIEEQVLRIGHLTDITDPSTFVANQIQANPSDPRIGNEAARIQVAILKEASDELALGAGNTVTFFSACASSGWATLNPTTVNLDTGVGYAEYAPDERCAGQDVLYARINDNFSNLAKVTVTNQSPTGSTPPSAYRVGTFNSSNDFQEDILGATPQVLVNGAGGANSTELHLAIVDNNDAPVISSGLSVDFTSMCLDAGRAVIETTGNTNSGQLLATYTAEGPAGTCAGTDSVYALVGTDNQLRASVDLSISESSFAIGSFDSSDLFVPYLASDKTTLDYNAEAEPSTSIRSIVGSIDNSGAFSQIIGNESNVEFFSTCIDSGLSAIETTGTTTSGELVSTYKALSCVGDDTLYARIAGTDTIASTTLTILPKLGKELALGHFDAGTFNAGVIGNTRNTPLPFGVQTKLYLSIADAQTQVQVKGQPLTVRLTSQCGEQSNATSPLSSNTASVSLGYIEVLYTAQSCGIITEDLVRAELTGVEGFTATAETVIELADLPANSITAELPSPNSIAPSWYSTQDRETTSTLQVQLKDNQNNGIEGETIMFALDNPGAVDVAVLDPVNGGLTTSDGYAEVKIKALDGFDNVVFRVIASYTDGSGNLLEVYSTPIAVNSKLPHEDRFSLSTSNYAPDTQNRDGEQVELTLLAADDQGNRIRGNTVVNFETFIGASSNPVKKGSIDPECILDNEGRCTITWESLGIDSQNAAEKYATVIAYTHGRLANGSTGRIESSVQMLMSTSDGIDVVLKDASGNATTTMPSTGGEFCAESWVDILNDGTQTKNSPPVGTTLTFEAQGGKLVPSSSGNFTLGSSGILLNEEPSPADSNVKGYSFIGCTYIEPDPTSTDPLKLTVTATPPNGQGVYKTAQ